MSGSTQHTSPSLPGAARDGLISDKIIVVT